MSLSKEEREELNKALDEYFEQVSLDDIVLEYLRRNMLEGDYITRIIDKYVEPITEWLPPIEIENGGKYQLGR